MSVHSSFTLKTTLFWLITKLKVQNLIHFFISHSLSQNQKFKSLILLFIYFYIFVVLLFYSQSVMELLFLLYIFVKFFLLHMLYFYFKIYCQIVMVINIKLEIGCLSKKKNQKLVMISWKIYYPKTDQITRCTLYSIVLHMWLQN